VDKPREYELVCVFNVKENHYATGLEAVKKLLGTLNCKIVKEEDMGDRQLAFLINKEDRGHYHLINFSTDEDNFIRLDEQLKLLNQLLRHLVVKVEAPRRKKVKKTRKAAAAKAPASEETADGQSEG
jgi:small subunit ribosomal protein S6